MKPKFTTEVIRRYYVQIGDWIYGGPFETRQEAEACLRQAIEAAEQESNQ